MIVPIRNIGQYGVVLDTPAHRLPANAWTNAQNMRFYDNYATKVPGVQQIFGTPLAAPRFVYHHENPDTNLWVYGNNTGMYATDGIAHSDITNVGGPYTATDQSIWQGAYLGGIEIFNNGIDIPQAWLNPAVGTDLVDLPNWVGPFTTAKVIKSYKQHLVALDVTKLGTRFPYLVKWSHVADPGTVPSSWDETDPTLDAGEYALADAGGLIVDGVTLNDSLLIYKEQQTWSMDFIGGPFIFSFRRLFNFGALGQRNVVEWKSRHYVATEEDVVAHNGVESESVLDNKTRRWYKSNVNPVYAHNQFCFLHSSENELWVCMPVGGSEYANMALILNLKDQTSTLQDLPSVGSIASGPIFSLGSSTAIDDLEGTFDELEGSFDSGEEASKEYRLVGALPEETKLVVFREGFDELGVPTMAVLERQSMPVAGLTQNGDVILSHTSIKQVNEVWPEVRMQNGSVLDVYVGGQMTLNEPITWEGPLPFTVGVDSKVDCLTAYRYVSIKFKSEDNSRWQLDAYSLNLEVIGEF